MLQPTQIVLLSVCRLALTPAAHEGDDDMPGILSAINTSVNGNPLKAIDASDLGWEPGFFPRAFTSYGIHYWALRAERDDDGDVQWVDYLDRSTGTRLRVFND